MNILAFAASNNRNSINQTLALYTASLIHDAQVETIDLNEFEMPIYSDARDEQHGPPQQARNFVGKMAEADALITSFAEQNGSSTAAFKNLFDWASRVDRAIFQNKPTLFLSTSPGPGGAQSVLKAAIEAAPYMGAKLIANLSVPSFFKNFDLENLKITNPRIQQQLNDAVRKLAQATEGALTSSETMR